jgi:hypothetical protein
MLQVIKDPLQGLQTVINQFSRRGGIDNVKRFVESLLPDFQLIKTYRASASGNGNKDQLLKGFETVWKGISTSEQNLRITGIISSSQSPIGLCGCGRYDKRSYCVSK